MVTPTHSTPAPAAGRLTPAEMHHRVYRWVRVLAHRYGRRLRLDAEEVEQEVWLLVCKYAETYDPGRGELTTWMSAVVRQAAHHMLARRRRRDGVVRLAPLPHYPDGRPMPFAAPGPGPDETTAAAEWRERARERVRAAIDRLPPRQRLAMTLRHVDGLSQPEAAAVMGISRGGVSMLERSASAHLIRVLSGGPT